MGQRSLPDGSRVLRVRGVEYVLPATQFAAAAGNRALESQLTALISGETGQGIGIRLHSKVPLRFSLWSGPLGATPLSQWWDIPVEPLKTVI